MELDKTLKIVTQFLAMINLPRIISRIFTVLCGRVDWRQANPIIFISIIMIPSLEETKPACCSLALCKNQVRILPNY